MNTPKITIEFEEIANCYILTVLVDGKEPFRYGMGSIEPLTFVNFGIIAGQRKQLQEVIKTLFSKAGSAVFKAINENTHNSSVSMLEQMIEGRINSRTKQQKQLSHQDYLDCISNFARENKFAEVFCNALYGEIQKLRDDV